MTIECYFKECKKHSIHGFPEDGPFCYEDECRATSEEIVTFAKLRKALLESYNIRPDPE